MCTQERGDGEEGRDREKEKDRETGLPPSAKLVNLRGLPHGPVVKVFNSLFHSGTILSLVRLYKSPDRTDFMLEIELQIKGKGDVLASNTISLPLPRDLILLTTIAGSLQ